jgi:hypothetical protein
VVKESGEGTTPAPHSVMSSHVWQGFKDFASVAAAGTPLLRGAESESLHEGSCSPGSLASFSLPLEQLENGIAADGCSKSQKENFLAPDLSHLAQSVLQGDSDDVCNLEASEASEDGPCAPNQQLLSKEFEKVRRRTHLQSCS